MNIHPAFVHFPIALFCTYAALEFTTRNKKWDIVKLTLLMFGVVSVFFTLATGEMAADEMKNTVDHDVLEMHELFATITTWTFVLIAAAYLASYKQWSVKKVSSLKRIQPVLDYLYKAGLFIRRLYILLPLVALGVLAVFVTGSLGATMVYGADVDPIVRFVNDILF